MMIPLRKEKKNGRKLKKIVGNANLHFYSGHGWILRASELVSVSVQVFCRCCAIEQCVRASPEIILMKQCCAQELDRADPSRQT